MLPGPFAFYEPHELSASLPSETSSPLEQHCCCCCALVGSGEWRWQRQLERALSLLNLSLEMPHESQSVASAAQTDAHGAPQVVSQIIDRAL